MKVIKILNLYSCLGGNRYKWDEVAKSQGFKIKVTAIEMDPELARLYQERFPEDEVIVTDAHKYLIENYKEFDIIWSSPPCPSHSRARFWNSKSYDTKNDPVYPDLKLYEEILFLNHYFEGKFIVENVIPYYKPLIHGKKRGRHLFWCNFNIPNVLSKRKIQIGAGKNEFKKLCNFHNIDLSEYQGEQRKLKIARNLVDYEAGKTIMETALKIIKSNNVEQKSLF